MIFYSKAWLHLIRTIVRTTLSARRTPNGLTYFRDLFINWIAEVNTKSPITLLYLLCNLHNLTISTGFDTVVDSGISEDSGVFSEDSDNNSDNNWNITFDTFYLKVTDNANDNRVLFYRRDLIDNEDDPRIEIYTRSFALAAFRSLVTDGYWFQFTAPITGLTNPEGRNSTLCAKLQLLLSMGELNVFLILDLLATTQFPDGLDYDGLYVHYMFVLKEMKILSEKLDYYHNPEKYKNRFNRLIRHIEILTNLAAPPDGQTGRVMAHTSNRFMNEFFNDLNTFNIFNVVLHLISSNHTSWPHRPVLADHWNPRQQKCKIYPWDTIPVFPFAPTFLQEVMDDQKVRYCWSGPNSGFVPRLYLIVHLDKRHFKDPNYQNRYDNGFHDRVLGLRQIVWFGRHADGTERQVVYRLKAVATHEVVGQMNLFVNNLFTIYNEHATTFRVNDHGLPEKEWIRFDDWRVIRHQNFDSVRRKAEIAIFEAVEDV